MRNIGICGALLFLAASCTRADQAEAARLTKTLESQRSAITSMDADFNDLVTRVGDWARGIMRSGGGGRQEVSQVQAVVDGMRHQLVFLDSYIERIPLHESETQLQRARLTRAMRDYLASLAPLSAELSEAYSGYATGPDRDHYPHAVRQIEMTVSAIRPKPIPIDDVIDALRRRYALSDEQIANAEEFGAGAPSARAPHD